MIKLNDLKKSMSHDEWAIFDGRQRDIENRCHSDKISISIIDAQTYAGTCILFFRKYNSLLEATMKMNELRTKFINNLKVQQNGSTQTKITQPRA